MNSQVKFEAPYTNNLNLEPYKTRNHKPQPYAYRIARADLLFNVGFATPITKYSCLGLLLWKQS